MSLVGVLYLFYISSANYWLIALKQNIMIVTISEIEMLACGINLSDEGAHYYLKSTTKKNETILKFDVSYSKLT